MLSTEKITANIAGIILAPRRTLPKLSHESGSWIPVMIVVVLLAISRWILLPELMATYNSSEFVAKYAQKLNMTEVEALKEVKLMRRAAPIVALIETPFIVFSGVAIVGFIIFSVGKFRYKSITGFFPYYRIVAWSSIVSGIPLALSIPLKLINPNWNFPSNFSFLLPDDWKISYFYQIIQTIDVFLLWEVWLISIGFATLCNISIQKSVRTIGTIFIIFIVLNALALTQAY